MKNNSLLVVAVCAGFLLTGCGASQPKSANSDQAVEQAKQLKTPEEQAKYLISEAKAFVSAEKFDEAAKTAQYVLQNLDANSQEAKEVIATTAEELQKKAAAAAEEMKKKLNAFGK